MQPGSDGREWSHRQQPSFSSRRPVLPTVYNLTPDHGNFLIACHTMLSLRAYDYACRPWLSKAWTRFISTYPLALSMCKEQRLQLCLSKSMLWPKAGAIHDERWSAVFLLQLLEELEYRYPPLGGSAHFSCLLLSPLCCANPENCCRRPPSYVTPAFRLRTPSLACSSRAALVFRTFPSSPEAAFVNVHFPDHLPYTAVPPILAIFRLFPRRRPVLHLIASDLDCTLFNSPRGVDTATTLMPCCPHWRPASQSCRRPTGHNLARYT